MNNYGLDIDQDRAMQAAENSLKTAINVGFYSQWIFYALTFIYILVIILIVCRIKEAFFCSGKKTSELS